MNERLVEAIAERNIHIREMLELHRLAQRLGAGTESTQARLDDWCRDWMERNPRQAALFQSRFA